MKTIFKDGVYDRVNNELGELRTKAQGWEYVSKQKWKENVRDINKKIKLEPLPEIYAETDKVVKKKKYQKPKKS